MSLYFNFPQHIVEEIVLLKTRVTAPPRRLTRVSALLTHPCF